MSSPWNAIRRDFPAATRHVYLNAAAAGPTPRPVREAVGTFCRELEEGGDLHWEAWLEEREVIRARVARFLGAESDEIAFVPNTSAGINLIADLLADEGPVLSDELEFPTVTIPWIHRGVPVHFVSAVEGVPPLESFSAPPAPRAASLVVSHVQFSNGCRLDLEALGAAKANRRLVVCASQSLGAFPVDVKAARIDALASAGHKWLCAGYGAGLLYVHRPLLASRPPRAIGWLSVEDPFSFDNRRFRVRPQASRIEMGCPPFAGIFALGAAVRYLSGIGLEAIADRVLELNRALTDGLAARGFEVLSPGDPHRSGQTLVALPDPPRAVAFLKERGVLVTEKPQGVRIATHFFNDESDLEACLTGLADYRKEARR